ncbi:polysaccharide deacetylase family protein [Chelativorans sp. AA-79]|uniref:polysaccharide deacetylase family protein n=1 Tax=Chelativorans sp. AA-79 TaxID=3028735 RepID=UPI0023F97559|nr:polysaccharide deacetylase family protein [Chelativorans sp. AA-79]WEX10628.1 polysaccharide deacetylase family protein [Chelativorans sp. AA-79]
MGGLGRETTELIDRAVNRLVWKMGSREREVATETPLVTFTFDDVPETALTNGAAILERHGARGTFYISGGIASSVEPGRTLISSEGCRALSQRGHEVGCHTFAHRKLRLIGGDLVADLTRNTEYLRGAGVEEPIRNFSFPFNAAWPPARKMLGSRFATCRGAGEEINRGRADHLMLKSVEIRQPETHARSLTRWIDDVAAQPGWLIFFTHDITETPTPFGCTPETFDHLVAHAKAKGCRVVTVREAVELLGWEG